MALPKQVQQQADAVALFEQEQAEAAAAAAAATGQPEPPATPEAGPPSGDAVPSVAVVEPTRVDGQWEQKYRSLQGMFQRETQLHQQSRTLIHDLTEQLAKVTEQVQALRAPQPAKPSALVTEEDDTRFGADLVDMARRVARDEFGAREQGYKDQIATLQAQVQAQVGEVQQTQQQSSRDGFFTRLQAAVPTWETMQASPECQQWLASRIPGSDMTWNTVLVDAADKFDAPRAIEVFQTFAAVHAPAPPPAAPPPAARKPDLSRQISPARSNGTPSTSSGEKRIYTGADYAAESQQVIRLTKAGKYDEANRIQAELDTALAEGRITP